MNNKKTLRKLLFSAMLICQPLLQSEQQLPISHLPNLAILLDDPSLDGVGYDNCDMSKNGEKLVLNAIHAHDTVFDVGANVGDWSQNILALQPAITLHCFEPAPPLCNLLKESLKGSILINQVALSDINGTARFNFYSQQSALSTLHRRPPQIESKLNMQPTFYDVALQRLDTYCAQNNITHIHFLKIDTEGNELSVLKGSEMVLAAQGVDFIQFEYGGCYKDSNTTLEQVYTLLTSYNFTIYRISSIGLIKVPLWRSGLENYRYANYLAIRNSLSQ